MTSTQRLTDRKREAIVQAAIAEFRAHGYDGTSVDKVAARAEGFEAHAVQPLPEQGRALRRDPGRAVAQQRQPGGAALSCRYTAARAAPRADDAEDGAAGRRQLPRPGARPIAATIHSPERAQELINRLGEKESSVLGWIRAAQRDGRLKPGDAALAAQQLESLVKGVAFWPQVTMGQPKLSPREQRKVAGAAVDLFLSHYAA